MGKIILNGVEYAAVDISGKADKVSGATNGNLAGLDANGNLTDSGVKEDVSTTTLNGNPLSFTTDSEQVARECIITLNPIQSGSGDPSPSNVRAISGRNSVKVVCCGKNLVNIEDKTGITSQTLLLDNILLGAGSYTLSALMANFGSNAVQLKVEDATSDICVTSEISSSEYQRSTGTFTLSEDAAVKILAKGTASGYNLSVKNIQLELGSTATAYEPYNPITDYSESLPETVYGGTLDVETGELVVDRGIVDLGELGWTLILNTTNCFYSINDIGQYIGLGKTFVAPIYQSANNVNSSANVNGNPDYSICGIAVGSNRRIYIKDSRYSDATTLKTNLSGVMCIYTLAEPYTIQLTPAQVRLLQGNNVVTTNGTSIKLTYRNGELATLADVSSVAESVNAFGKIRLNNDNIAPTEPTNKASTAYAVGTYFFDKTGHFRRVTSAIAQGSTITDNNSTITTIGAELVRIASL